VTDIFDGNIPLYFYYTDDKRYALQPRECFVEVNNTEIKELKRILGDENVVFVH
jgi:DNA polymerase-3 subunit alpha